MMTSQVRLVMPSVREGPRPVFLALWAPNDGCLVGGEDMRRGFERNLID